MGKVRSHAEVNEWPDNSDDEYQTSVESDSEFETNHQKGTRQNTHTSILRPNVEVIKGANGPPNTAVTWVNQPRRTASRSNETEQLAQKFDELRSTFSTMLPREEIGGNSGVWQISPPVMSSSSRVA